ncbi:hypothetical protein Patl1_19343 [Pistacia atlantica]|uniref:Uncharacterized protein n=2 Tax=Pistacia atlantica TaxID=434234 RepID=A0ACC1C320_9ROSI|nr:hypothetical protein Patl1_13375 [Pistacia atlantica]KAJ0106661.1 hypothetical protein Patl1_19343 [Pistacia atlantica]
MLHVQVKEMINSNGSNVLLLKKLKKSHSKLLLIMSKTTKRSGSLIQVVHTM